MAETIKGLERTARCAELSKDLLNSDVTVMGWCHKQRNLGGLIFITLRDRSGEIQLVIDDDSPADIQEKATKVRSEFVLAVCGKFVKRKAVNPEQKMGEYEIQVKELRILSESKTPPFYIEPNLDVKEQLRLQYRYLDLRRSDLQERLMLRHRIVAKTREFFDREGFLDIETPTLVKSTPEGARDYVVPSRVFKGEFFALPQSPQVFKQLLMLSGFDRYMQIARCYRDEDLRADRQPEFTQIDVEMAFVSESDVMSVMERYLVEILAEIKGVHLTLPLPTITWHEAMSRYGSDKPDTRFGMELVNVSHIATEMDFAVFADAIKNGGSVRMIVVKDGAQMSRREIDSLTEVVKACRAKGLAWLALDEPMRGSITKFVEPATAVRLAAVGNARQGDLLLFVADTNEIACSALGQLRLELAKRLKLIPENMWNLLWVTHFPLLERDEEANRYVACHHPFTAPCEEDSELLLTNPDKVRAKAYDVVLNGIELGSGSIRIHDQAMQEHMFSLLGFTHDSARSQFGFLLEAFEYGVPPHGGMALGLDRFVMLLTGAENIREVMAFPKVQNSSDLMMSAPSPIASQQLDELGLNVVEAVARAAERDISNEC